MAVDLLEGAQGLRPASAIFEIPIDLAHPTELLGDDLGLGIGGEDTPGHVRQRARRQPVARHPGPRRRAARADLVYCDGYGVRLAARVLKRPVPHRMTGADWIWGLARLCELAGHPVYLLGSEPPLAREAAGRLRRLYPGLDVVGAHHGFFELDSPHNERVIEHINAHRPRIVLVGMGTPKQELWVDRYADRLDGAVVWTVGALFDYVSGRTPRAPALAGGQRTRMDLPTRDRASTDVAPVPAREPDLPEAGADRGAPPARRDPDSLTAPRRPLPRLATEWVLGGAIVLAGLVIALALQHSAGVVRPVATNALPGVLRTAAAGIGLFGLCGWGLSFALAPEELRPHRLLLAVPLGAATSSFALAVLGLLHVPFDVSLALVLAVAVGAALRYGLRLRPRPRASAGASIVRLGVPLALATIVALISLIPIFRAGFETIPGQNGDAILVSGSAVLVEHAPPTATRNDLPINRIPLQWRSKYPIYYALAAVSTLAGQTPIQAFATVSALVLAATALGLFLFALYALRAPPWVALLTALLVPLDRIVVYVTIHPYYNELWGQFALPFMLLFGWLYLSAPSRRSAALFLLFLVFGLLVYPLMVLFPVVFLVPLAWSRWRERRGQGKAPGWISALRLPRARGRRWVWIPAAVIAVPVVAVLVRGFVEKALSALDVLLPGTNLSSWSGSALPYIPGPQFFGMPGASLADYLGVGAVGVLAAVGLRRVRPELRVPMGAMVVVTALIGVYFRVRGEGQLFYFKDLAFLGPYALILALMGLAALTSSRRRLAAAAGVAGVAGALAVVPVGAGREINVTFLQATPQVLGLAAWDRALPRDASIRIDVPPSGWQLWADYMLHDHPLSALAPLGIFFPHPPVGRKADYALTFRPQPRPADAFGRPVQQNGQYELWRLRPSVPGPDVSHRGLIWDVTKITF